MTNNHAKKLSALAAEARRKIPPEKRKEIATKAAKARWRGHNKKRKPSL